MISKLCVRCGGGASIEAGRRQCRVCRNAAAVFRYRIKHGPVRRSRWDKNRLSREEARARNLDSQRRSKLRLKYEMTLEAYLSMVDEQEGKCAICSSPERLSVDHNHASGHVRKLLCNNCNVGIGHFRESPALLRAAAIYLETVGINPVLAAEVIKTLKETMPV